jgi:hypothetical protein
MKASRLRQWMLTLLGIGAAGTVLGSPEGSNTVFAKQFLGKGAEMNIPKMVYDPQLQMMVDPATGQPLYEKNKDMKLAKVTAGCSDCPKYDE